MSSERPAFSPASACPLSTSLILAPLPGPVSKLAKNHWPNDWLHQIQHRLLYLFAIPAGRRTKPRLEAGCLKDVWLSRTPRLVWQLSGSDLLTGHPGREP